MSLLTYILDKEGVPVQEPNIFAWGRWFEETKDRIIQQDTIKTATGDVLVSTVFLGIDYSFLRGGKPVLFETMIFESNIKALHEYQERYRTREQAIKGHSRAVSLVKSMELEVPSKEPLNE